MASSLGVVRCPSRPVEMEQAAYVGPFQGEVLLLGTAASTALQFVSYELR